MFAPETPGTPESQGSFWGSARPQAHHLGEDRCSLHLHVSRASLRTMGSRNPKYHLELGSWFDSTLGGLGLCNLCHLKFEMKVVVGVVFVDSGQIFWEGNGGRLKWWNQNVTEFKRVTKNVAVFLSRKTLEKHTKTKHKRKVVKGHDKMLETFALMAVGKKNKSRKYISAWRSWKQLGTLRRFVCIYLCIYLSICLSISQSVNLSICLSVYLSSYLYTCILSINLQYLSIHKIHSWIYFILFLQESIKICIDLQCYALFMDNFWPLFTMRHLVWAIDQTLSMTLPQPCESHLHHHLPSNAQLPTWRIMTVLEIFGRSSIWQNHPNGVENSEIVQVIRFVKVEFFHEIIPGWSREWFRDDAP